MSRPRNTSVDAARKTFGQVGLPLPPVPERFEKVLRQIHPWCFGTRKVSGMAMYFFDRYWQEPLTRSTRAYVAFSHAGHGANSYAITYHLVDGPLARFVQDRFGGIYADERRDRRAIKALFRRCAASIAAIDKAKARGLPGPPGRLIVIESPMRGLQAWGWLEHPLQGPEEAKTWVTRHRVWPIEYPPGQTRIQPERLPTAAARQWLLTGALRPLRPALSGDKGPGRGTFGAHARERRRT